MLADDDRIFICILFYLNFVIIQESVLAKVCILDFRLSTHDTLELHRP
ncbi:MAG: hypothetical protein UT80_C0048G0004 [Parcubacteria group bacterium GW2011_GWC1_40_13]|nr:MAG: hypothetical protein UT80_C0048G0004 [Parcubacteria group bacterium GW2011_GWC1_40_13]